MMTLSEIHQLSAEHLAVMNDTDFELISEQGFDFRRALSDRVLHYLERDYPTNVVVSPLMRHNLQNRLFTI